MPKARTVDVRRQLFLFHYGDNLPLRARPASTSAKIQKTKGKVYRSHQQLGVAADYARFAP
jgi:hypothetical protein